MVSDGAGSKNSRNVEKMAGKGLSDLLTEQGVQYEP